MTPRRLGIPEAGEILTLQRAAYVTEAQLHDDLKLPPLTQTLAELQSELGRDDVTAWGLHEAGRLVACLRVRRLASRAEIGRIVVAPDRQGAGLGTSLLTAVERVMPDDVLAFTLFTGERSAANLRLYQRLGYRETHRTSAGPYEVVHLHRARGVSTG